MVVLGQLLQHPCGIVLELGLLPELLWVRMRSEVWWGRGGGVPAGGTWAAAATSVCRSGSELEEGIGVPAASVA